MAAGRIAADDEGRIDHRTAEDLSVFGYFRRRRRLRLRATPLPPDWPGIIDRNAPFCAALSEAERSELQGHIRVFLAEKHFEGCNGLELTDEIRVTIAAHACRLLLHRDADIFPRLATVLVYPTAYIARAVEPLGGGAVLEGEQVRLGEAWKDGVAVVSWDDLRATIAGRNPGRNLILHEFAHILDMEDGASDGTPILASREHYASWVAIMDDEYAQLRRDWHLGRYSVLDHYGATNPAEFFAVATEAFFEKPTVLARRHPELYAELRRFYCQDPAGHEG
jgi:Mlc titration factor MtfA (ptsG expression regulator)